MAEYRSPWCRCKVCVAKMHGVEARRVKPSHEQAKEFIEATDRPSWERATKAIEHKAWLHGYYYGVGTATGIAGLVLIVGNL